MWRCIGVMLKESWMQKRIPQRYTTIMIMQQNILITIGNYWWVSPLTWDMGPLT